MDLARFHAITGVYPRLRVGVLGDFCLDRYLEIDPTREEVSIETGLPVHNVVNVRAQPGGAGTILNNLVAQGIGTIHPIGFAGDDGEGFELRRALESRPGVRLDFFIKTNQRRTFTYCKPLVVAAGKAPVELNRLDSKNWTPTPPAIEEELARRLLGLSGSIDALIVLDQVDLPQTGVVTTRVLKALDEFAAKNPGLPVLADGRRGLAGFPPVIFKMNAEELQRSRVLQPEGPRDGLHAEGALCPPAATARQRGESEGEGEELRRLGVSAFDDIKQTALALARKNQRPVFITLSERGILGAAPGGRLDHVPALATRGPIDIVGAGDAVSANLTTALAAGATVNEAMELANAAASIVIHKLGTTGTASVAEIAELAR
ncbi:MAG TPA: PfkB family carbohydrate kinase [Verrucomicrobiae bacterium]|nr:PfkB family carbohydrate kinase [Verrucomicrobiae bacterium]